MPRSPRAAMPDGTLELMRDPYGFIVRHCRLIGSDLFETRILLRRTICMTGPEAAAFFYDPARFTRVGAAPTRLLKTLFGEGGVQGLDGPGHRHRKEMFTSVTGPEPVGRLADALDERLAEGAAVWAGTDSVVLYDRMREVLTRAVCDWSGVPLAEREVERRTRDLAATYEDAASAGPRQRRARRARVAAERWIGGLVEEVRAGRADPPEGSAADVIARHRGPDGALLPVQVATVELLNVLRPTVAVAVYLTFVAHALHEHPEWHRRLRSGADPEPFVQEVRRHYPFFPFVVARVREDCEWRGYRFPAGRRVLLDLYGTDHDPRAWEQPGWFMPERFAAGQPGDFAFIPQGGGDIESGHRCPGEPVAVALMRTAAEFLTRRVDYTVPPQDLGIDRTQAPALPRDRFVIGDVVIRD